MAEERKEASGLAAWHAKLVAEQARRHEQMAAGAIESRGKPDEPNSEGATSRAEIPSPRSRHGRAELAVEQARHKERNELRLAESRHKLERLKREVEAERAENPTPSLRQSSPN